MLNQKSFMDKVTLFDFWYVSYLFYCSHSGQKPDSEEFFKERLIARKTHIFERDGKLYCGKIISVDAMTEVFEELSKLKGKAINVETPEPEFLHCLKLLKNKLVKH